jgi:hypothetical protein
MFETRKLVYVIVPLCFEFVFLVIGYCLLFVICFLLFHAYLIEF